MSAPELADKVVLVTGAGSGIGRGIADVLAREGAELVLTDVDLASAKRVAAELGATAFEHDVTSWDSCHRVVSQVLEEKGRIDVLVNNAGVSKSVPFHELDEAEWDRVNDINAKGVFLSTRAVVPHMIKGGFRLDHQHLLDGGQGGDSPVRPLLCVEVRGDRIDPGTREGAGSIRHQGQRRVPRRCSHAVVGAAAQPALGDQGDLARGGVA